MTSVPSGIKSFGSRISRAPSASKAFLQKGAHNAFRMIKQRHSVSKMHVLILILCLGVIAAVLIVYFTVDAQKRYTSIWKTTSFQVLGLSSFALVVLFIVNEALDKAEF